MNHRKRPQLLIAILVIASMLLGTSGAAFAAAPLPVNLAVSLHVANDRERNELVPINRRDPLAELAREVYTIEIIPELGIKAKSVLDTLGYKNIRYKTADGYRGWQEMAPFDAIVVTAAIAETPPDLLDQLAENGRMILPLGPEGDTQYLVLICLLYTSPSPRDS